MKDERKNRPSASAVELYSKCHGAYLLCKQVPESEKFRDESAAIGTRVHEANETGDASELESLFEVDMVSAIRQREEEIYLRWQDEFQIKDAEIFREKRLWLKQAGVDLISGKLDFFALSEKTKHACILDAKSGRIAATPSPKNLQLRTQAVLVAANYGIVHVRVGIVQPMARTQSLVDYDPDSLYNKGGAWDQLNELLAKIEAPDAPRTAGSWCNRCDARHCCPEASAVVNDLAALTGLKWSTLAPGEKLRLWEVGKVAAKIISAIEQNVKAELTANPEAIPGLTKKPDTSARVVSSAIGAYQTLQAEFPNLKPEELNAKFDEFCDFSIGPVEEWYRNVHGGTAKAAQAWFNSKMKDYIKQVPRSGSVVRVKE